MNKYVLISAMFVIGTGVCHAQSPASKVATQKGWLADLPTAQAQAKKTGKPIMLVFRCDP